MDSSRPNPDKLLAAISDNSACSRRGKLKIYLGMSAGVGKTYAMLEDAAALRTRGVDVVCGYIEPHGRVDTEALAARLEQIPPRQVVYRELCLRELDLDAVLGRAPKIVLVDELAHTNAPGCRHGKRFQDVEELLAAGIDVYTTVNIQHLESLRDVIVAITGVTVSETIPDSWLAEADEVELVDIPPDELIQRLREGKVYAPGKIDGALSNFFRKGNLIALRELVLRQTANRVNAQMRRYREANQVHTIWPTTERIMVCVAPNALSSKIVRAAARMASASNAQLIALSVENSRYVALTDSQRQKAAEALRLAESLGAETTVRAADDIVGEILQCAREKNVSGIVVGKPLRARWREFLYGSVVDELIQRSDEINVHIITGAGTEGTPVKHLPRVQELSPRGSLVALGVTALSTLISYIMSPFFDPSNLIMIYMLGIAWISTRYGRLESGMAAVLSVAAFDFFFVPPFMTFRVSDAQYLVTFLVMLLVALLLSGLNLRVRYQSMLVSERERRTSALYELGKRLLSIRELEGICSLMQEKITELFRRDSVVFGIGSNGKVQTQVGSLSGFERQGNERAVAQWVTDRGTSAGPGTGTLEASKALYLPIKTESQCLGVVGVSARPVPLSGYDEDLLETLVNQFAIAMDRVKVSKESSQALVGVERERLRNTLLSAVSHDLRTPLASITGAASALLDRPEMRPENRRTLLATVYEESQRLSRMVRNVLDITRLESPGVVLRAEWCALDEIVASAVNASRALLQDRKVEIDLPGDLPLVKVDANLFEQLFVNLFENVGKYTPANTAIKVVARADTESIVIDVIDNGPGITAALAPEIFQKWVRGEHPTSQGVGLGLAICRAVVCAHLGKMELVESSNGTHFRIQIPMMEQLPSVPPEIETM